MKNIFITGIVSGIFSLLSFIIWIISRKRSSERLHRHLSTRVGESLSESEANYFNKELNRIGNSYGLAFIFILISIVCFSWFYYNSDVQKFIFLIFIGLTIILWLTYVLFKLILDNKDAIEGSLVISILFSYILIIYMSWFLFDKDKSFINWLFSFKFLYILLALIALSMFIVEIFLRGEKFPYATIGILLIMLIIYLCSLMVNFAKERNKKIFTDSIIFEGNNLNVKIFKNDSLHLDNPFLPEKQKAPKEWKTAYDSLLTYYIENPTNGEWEKTEILF